MGYRLKTPDPDATIRLVIVPPSERAPEGLWFECRTPTGLLIDAAQAAAGRAGRRILAGLEPAADFGLLPEDLADVFGLGDDEDGGDDAEPDANGALAYGQHLLACELGWRLIREWNLEDERGRVYPPSDQAIAAALSERLIRERFLTEVFAHTNLTLGEAEGNAFAVSPNGGGAAASATAATASV